MVHYPNCPFCGNASLSIVDVEVVRTPLKGIQCNACEKFIGFYKDDSEKLNELFEKVENLDSKMCDLER